MSQSNLIEVHIPESDLAEIRTAVATLRGKLLPRLQTLAPQERMEMPKMGDKTVAFVQKVQEYAKRNAALVPPFLDMDAMAADFAAVQTLRELSQDMVPVVEALTDSLMLSGSEAYQGALVFYNNVKGAAKNKAPGAAAIYEDLSARFPGAAGRRKADSSSAK
jgi:hypothetical protein